MLWPQGVIPKAKKNNHPPNYKKIQNYMFDLNDILGAGNFSKVYKAVNQTTNQVSAIKVVQLSSMKNKTLVDLLYSQIEILKTLKHPNILNCIEVFSSNNNCYIITQLCNQGDLESRIKNWGPLSESQARKVIYQTFSGLKYLSDQHIIHRDLKVANIFLKNGIVKIADFGFVRKLKTPNQHFKDINIGSPIYMSPQGLIQNYYGPKTDVWAFGILLYELLHGDTPLSYCQTQSQLLSNLQVPLTKNRISQTISNQLKDLMLRCLQINEKKRISFQQMYNHPYLLYLRKLYEKPIQTLQPNIIQTPKLKTNQNTYQTQQPKSQTETQALMNQYNNMPPQQRASSSVSLGSLSINGLSGVSITPNQHIFSSPMKNIAIQQLKPLNTLNNQTQFHQIFQIPQPSHLPVQNLQHNQNNTFIKSNQQLTIVSNNTNNVHNIQIINKNQTNIISNLASNIITKSISFPESVQLLHYCRLIYKSYNLVKKVKGCNHLIPYLSNWLLSLLSQIEQKQTTHVIFAGQRAALRQQKLHQVITEYGSKYKSQIAWMQGFPINIFSIQPLIQQALVHVDSSIKTQSNPNNLQYLIKLGNYLLYLKETNSIIKMSAQTGDFSPIISAKIQQFLNRKKDTFTLQSYEELKNKI